MADFDDLIEANRTYAATEFEHGGFDGIARAGIAVVTCMDSRIDPLRMLGLKPGDAKIFRNAGARITEPALEALILAVHLLNVERILIVAHTRCAVVSNSEAQLQQRVGAAIGQDITWQRLRAVADQDDALRRDVNKLRTHPLIGATVTIGGFLYDVDTGLISKVV